MCTYNFEKIIYIYITIALVQTSLSYYTHINCILYNYALITVFYYGRNTVVAHMQLIVLDLDVIQDIINDRQSLSWGFCIAHTRSTVQIFEQIIPAPIYCPGINNSLTTLFNNTLLRFQRLYHKVEVRDIVLFLFLFFFLQPNPLGDMMFGHRSRLKEANTVCPLSNRVGFLSYHYPSTRQL